jgi:hypothetical protein
LDAGVVAGRDVVEAERLGAGHQGAELDLAVALQAGVRRVALSVFAYEVLDHELPELAPVVEDIVGNAELGADATSALGHLLRAAQTLFESLVIAIPKVHRDASDLVAGLVQQRRRERAVDAAAHGDHDLCHYFVLDCRLEIMFHRSSIC